MSSVAQHIRVPVLTTLTLTDPFSSVATMFGHGRPSGWVGFRIFFSVGLFFSFFFSFFFWGGFVDGLSVLHCKNSCCGCMVNIIYGCVVLCIELETFLPLQPLTFTPYTLAFTMLKVVVVDNCVCVCAVQVEFGTCLPPALGTLTVLVDSKPIVDHSPHMPCLNTTALASP